MSWWLCLLAAFKGKWPFPSPRKDPSSSWPRKEFIVFTKESVTPTSNKGPRGTSQSQSPTIHSHSPTVHSPQFTVPSSQSTVPWPHSPTVNSSMVPQFHSPIVHSPTVYSSTVHSSHFHGPTVHSSMFPQSHSPKLRDCSAESPGTVTVQAEP